MPHTTLIVHHIISLCALYNTCILHYVSKGTILISPYHIPHCTPRQDHSPQSMYYSSAPSWTISPLTQLRSRCGLCFFSFFFFASPSSIHRHSLHSSDLKFLLLWFWQVWKFREARQDHSPQSMYYSSASSSEKPDRTTVPRACSTILSLLQRSKTGPQSAEHVLQFCPLFRVASKTVLQSSEHILQFCPLFRKARQDHSHQSMSYSSAPSSEKPDRPQSPEHVLQLCLLFREARSQ